MIENLWSSGIHGFNAIRYCDVGVRYVDDLMVIGILLSSVADGLMVISQIEVCALVMPAFGMLPI